MFLTSCHIHVPPLCSGIVLCAVFHPSHLLLATGGDDGQIRIWDLLTKSCVAVLKDHYSAVTSLSFAPDGRTLLSGGRDGVVMAWSSLEKKKKGKGEYEYAKVATIPVHEAVEGVVAVGGDAFDLSPSVLCVATGGEKGVVKVWRVDTASCLFDTVFEKGVGPPPTAAGGIVELRTLPGHRGLLAATQDCRLLVMRYDTSGSSGSSNRTLQLERQFIGNNDEVTDLRFIALDNDDTNHPTSIAVATNSEHIRLFDTTSLSCVATLAGHKEAVLALDSRSVKVHSTGSTVLLASGSKDNTIRIWSGFGKGSTSTPRCIARGTGHVGAVSAVAFSRKSSSFVVSGGADKLLKVWDISTLEYDEEETVPSSSSSAVVALQATAAVAAHSKDINAVAVAPNDSVVATASQDRTVKIWQLPSLVLSLTLKGHRRGVWAVAFSPIDRAVVTASGDKTLKLWSLGDGSCLRTFEGHIASVLRVTFLSSGTQLLSAGGDGLLKLWNLKTSECVNTFDAHEDKVWALSVSSKTGDMVASGGADGSVALWRDATTTDAEEALREQEATLMKEQQLSNAMYAKDWKKAAQVAFEMRHPGRLLTVISSLLESGPPSHLHSYSHSYSGEEEKDRILQDMFRGLDAEQLKACLEYCREWNVSAKTCDVAQAVLGAVVRLYPPSILATVPGIDALLEALEAYTKRHFARADRMLRSTFVVEYVLGGANVVAPNVEEDDVMNGGGVDMEVAVVEDEEKEEELKVTRGSRGRKRKSKIT